MSFDRDEAVQQIADQVTELVEPRTHNEPFWTWTKGRHRKFDHWETRHASLLDQLRAQLPPSGSDDPDAALGTGGLDSTPPLVTDVLDRLMATEALAAWWASVRLRRDLRETVEENLRLLVGMAGRMEDHELRELAADVDRCHAWAATLTGWASPPWTPHVACPLCARMDSLRVNLDKKRAICLGCGEKWVEDDGTIGLLADHIRASDQRQMRFWEAGCDHSWRLTTVGPRGVSGRCMGCGGTAVRESWPKGTPVWTELDEQKAGAPA